MSWQGRRPRVSVLADMALRREKVMAELVRLREKQSLSQEEAARRIGIGLRQLQRWEAGESMPRATNLAQAALAYGVSPSVFYDEDEWTANGNGNGTSPAAPNGDLLARLAAIEDLVRLVRADLAAADAEALKRNEEVLRAIRDSR
jgi:transcriptional regulator with XRE-family HTH domain